jgi:4a-hydroxytetrahydrobiopterin dehydratase
MKLTEQHSSPIKAGTVPFSREEAEKFMKEIPAWSLEEKEITREFRFKDFRGAMAFVDSAAKIVNDEDHHPDIFISYNKVRFSFSTHKIGGLSINDFIVAAKIDALEANERAGKKVA